MIYISDDNYLEKLYEMGAVMRTVEDNVGWYTRAKEEVIVVKVGKPTGPIVGILWVSTEEERDELIKGNASE